MEPQNIGEYRGLRHEIATLKSCITTYIGFVFLVVSTAFWELAKQVPLRPKPTIALVALLLGLGLKLVLFLLMYKFHSHNRYCGYCKLLEQERFQHDPKNPAVPRVVFIWELCLDRLRQSDFRKGGLDLEMDDYEGHLPNEAGLKDKAREYSGTTPEADEGRFLKGWMLFLHSKAEERGTWQFPLYVARIFAAIDLGLCVLGLFLLLPRDLEGATQVLRGYPVHLPLPFQFWLLLLVLLLICWIKLIADLYKQMKGSQTVDAFCWKFVPIRQRILKDLGFSKFKLIACSPREPGGSKGSVSVNKADVG
jgi:hypothetical protein